MPTFDDIPSNAVFIGTFANDQAFESFVEDVWLEKLEEDVDVLPTGESGSLWPGELVTLWLRDGTVATDGRGSYFWLSAPHAEFWGRHEQVGKDRQIQYWSIDSTEEPPEIQIQSKTVHVVTDCQEKTYTIDGDVWRL